MIRFEQVTKRFGKKTVLDEATFTIAQGEVFIIVGLSGAGKSVTLKHMVRLLTPDEGQVWVGDDCVSEATGRDLERIRAKFGYLFQSGALLQWISAGENVALPLREHTKMTDDEIDGLVREKLRLVELEDAYDRSPSDLSGGMKKRVSLARAIVRQPEVVLYDEPTSGLDPLTSRTIDELIANTNRELGITSIVVTHDLHSALSIGTRIAMLHQGKVVELATPADFIHSSHPVVQQFLASQYITRKGVWEESVSS
ncbi:MAG: ATP-binding cassette domain-containing protein [Verrucomicrobia bacterium]|nr:ATP-binding cassette domain-containing protein [Kiritimatiellia bacterium]MCB1102525.1 ATP-binding cassette domain-containing protein [Kiritimatiellia bacterium]MCP5488900.1 ATP-binding cassette domain-containing protein [Verrucomicrobiota bacterium]